MLTEEIRVFNSDIQTYYYLHIRKDRVQAFYSLIAQERHPARVSSMPGLSWAAISGLDAIFERRPLKFPVYDILHWFCDNALTYAPQFDPPLTQAEIEHALERFATLYPTDVLTENRV